MMPFMTQPAVAPACYVPEFRDFHSLALDPARRLTRTFSAAGDRTKWTFDVCAEIDTVDREFYFLSTYNTYSAGNNYAFVRVETGGLLVLYSWNGSTTDFRAHSGSQLFRSPGRYHLHVEYDSGHGTAVERLRVWVNGVRISLTFVTEVGPGGNSDFNTAREHNVYGYHYGSIAYGNVGTGDRVAFISDAIVPVGDFGETNIHGVWVLKNVSVPAWGPNGFHLDFSDPLNLGKDVSGKGNHWTAMGFDATGKDCVSSTPTNVYATLNPLAQTGRGTLTDGGLLLTGTSTTAGVSGTSTLPLPESGGPFCWEVTAVSSGSGCRLGVRDMAWSAGGVWRYEDAAGFATGDVLGLVWYPGERVLKGYRNGVFVKNLPVPEAQLWPFVIPSQTDRAMRVNFGQRPFSYPAAYGNAKPLCTDNLPEPDVKDPGEAFAQVATTGANMDGALNALTEHWDGASYVEIVKRRDAEERWWWRFSDDPTKLISSDNNKAKAAVTALAQEGTYVGIRLRVGARYGAWTAEVSHTAGTATTVIHGLNTARNVVIATCVSTDGGDRYFRHPDMPATYLGKLNSNEVIGVATACAEFGSNSFQIASDADSGTYRVIVLAERPGYLALPSWNGSESEDGPFVSLDISPLFMLSRQSKGGAVGSGDWEVLTEATSPVNPRGNRLFLNTSWKEDIQMAPVDFVAGGVKLRVQNADWNELGKTYYGIAIGRPVGGVCVAPATGR